MEDVKERLTKRLSKIPGVTPEDISDWFTEAEAEFSWCDEEEEKPECENDETALMYLALYIAYESIASNAARYFSFKDGEESIDKSMIFDNYMRLAKSARRNYARYLRGGFGASQSHLSRADGK